MHTFDRTLLVFAYLLSSFSICVHAVCTQIIVIFSLNTSSFLKCLNISLCSTSSNNFRSLWNIGIRALHLYCFIWYPSDKYRVVWPSAWNEISLLFFIIPGQFCYILYSFEFWRESWLFASLRWLSSDDCICLQKVP